MLTATGAIGSKTFKSWLRGARLSVQGRYEDPDPMGGPGRIADWVELSALLSTDDSLSKTTVIDHLSSNGVVTEDEAEILASNAFSELALRSRDLSAQASDAFPFELPTGGTVLRRKHSWDQVPGYAFMLYASCTQLKSEDFIEGTSYDELGHLFESVVRESLVGIFRDPVRIIPASGQGTFEFLHARVEEECKHFNRSITDELRKQPRRQKDGGLDVIARLWLGDDRPASPHVLIQCAAGLADWHKKLRDPVAANWHDWVDWRGPIYRGFAMPVAFGDDAALKNASRTGEWTVILDRNRLLFGITRSGGLSSTLSSTLNTWLNCRWDTLRNKGILETS
jgi:hypothetical protein